VCIRGSDRAHLGGPSTSPLGVTLGACVSLEPTGRVVGMKTLVVNVVLSAFAGWFALLDRCLIAASDMPISGQIVTLLVLQAVIFALVMAVVNGAFPEVVEAGRSGASARLKLIVFVVPLILFIASPVMISDSLYEARYGSLDRLNVHAHVGHDLACCLNPFSTAGVTPNNR
jgi:hypothetical protein